MRISSPRFAMLYRWWAARGNYEETADAPDKSIAYRWKHYGMAIMSVSTAAAL